MLLLVILIYSLTNSKMMYFYDSAEVLRKTIQVVDWVRSSTLAVSSTIKCRLTDDATRKLSLQSNQKDVTEKYRKLYCATTEDILKTDLIRFDWEVFKIRSMPYVPRSFSKPHHKKIYLEATEEWSLS